MYPSGILVLKLNRVKGRWTGLRSMIVLTHSRSARDHIAFEIEFLETHGDFERWSTSARESRRSLVIVSRSKVLNLIESISGIDA